MSKADRSEELETLLEQVLQNADSVQKFQKQLGVGEDKPKGE